MAHTQLIDMGWKRIKLDFLLLKNKKIEVGLLDNTDDMATIASYQEYGTVHIPERPFLRTTIRHNQVHYQHFLQQKIRMMIQGSIAPNTILEHLGKKVMEDIQKSIINWSSPPNAASTIRQKGFNDPLVWSGLMWILIKYKII